MNKKIIMDKYVEQFNQERSKSAKTDTIVKKKKSSNNFNEITLAEFMFVGFIALVADLLGPIGFPCVLVLVFWHVMKFHKFPTRKISGAIIAEVVSLGFLPGWSGFVLIIFLEQRGYLPKWANKMTKGNI